MVMLPRQLEAYVSVVCFMDTATLGLACVVEPLVLYVLKGASLDVTTLDVPKPVYPVQL